MRCPTWWGGVLALACVVPGAAGAAAPAARSGDEADARNRLGVLFGVRGEYNRAESLFVALLAGSRGDPRALNNLGNLRLVRGELGVALAFYERALRGDSLDAGILLNHATALMLMGDEARARESAAHGVRVAGGVAQAEALLGITADGPGEGSRAAERKYVSKEEVRALLRSAARAVPQESLATGGAGRRNAAAKKPPTWRSAGPRASDAGDAAAVLYWKH